MITVIATEVSNRTNISCTVMFKNGRYKMSENATLYVQGLLSSASNIEMNINEMIFSFFWDPPFSLDISNLEVDFTFCVAFSCGADSSETVCKINNTRFDAPINNCRSENISIRITPVNGAGNGTEEVSVFPNPMAGMF